MFEATQEIMDAAGLPAYEISNHARTGQESRHNLTYWHYDDYIGIGPGAHGRYHDGAHRFATENHKAPDIWLAETAAQGRGVKDKTTLDNDTAMREALMMGLRLTSGIDLQNWRQKFSTALPEFLPTQPLSYLEKEGYIVRDEKTLRATPAGLQRLNAVLGYLERA